MKDYLSFWKKFHVIRYSAVRTNSISTNKNITYQGVNTRIVSYSDQWRTPKNVLTLGLIGLLSIAAGLLIWLINPYQVIFNFKCIFSENGEIFEMWRKPEIDLYLRVFLFNVTNREAFMEGRETLNVQEVGPYVYKELMLHDNVKFNSNGTLSTQPKHPLVWVPELSNGNLETDRLILPNIALLSITHVMSDSSYFTKLGLNLIIKQTNTQPLVEMSAREFMFGYRSSLVTLGNKLMPNWISFEKLGLIDRMYDFEGDFETVFTGEHNPKYTGLIDTYRGSRDLPQWKQGSYCANIHLASDGTKFPSYITDNDTLIFYRKSLCRGAKLIRENNQLINVQRLKGYQYKFIENAMDNGFFDENNKCFCRNDKCLRRGLLDVTDCYYGFPIALSYPHYLYADKTLREQVHGLKPTKTEHESYFIIQPETGMPLDIAMRMQINMAIGDVQHMANVRQFSNMAIPLLWTEHRMYSLPENLDIKFNIYLNILPIVSTAIMHILTVLGCVLILISLKRLFRVQEQWHRSKKSMFATWNDKNKYLVHNKSNTAASTSNGRHNQGTDNAGFYTNYMVPLDTFRRKPF